MCLNHEGSIFKVMLFSKIIDVPTVSASYAASFPDFLECGQEVEDMAVPGGWSTVLRTRRCGLTSSSGIGFLLWPNT